MSDYKEILEKAARLCSMSEKCRSDIHPRLIDWGLPEEQAEKALEYLEKNRFLDEKRYAGFFVKDKLRFNKWGKIKIAYSLRNKRIPDAIIKDALDTIGQDDYEALLDDLISSKIKSVGEPGNARNRAKIIRYAAQKGFSSEDIYNSLDRLKETE
ncbi:MAG: RecX family transcriptional regulator [Bacteroidales bacterium]|nr:RecX family transcriptional regulator [Bacteroidales bacterium]